MNKFVIIAVLASLAVAHGATFSSMYNTGILPLEKQAKLIDVVPTIGAVAIKGIKIGAFLLKKVWALAGLKLGALALAANVVIWLFKHSISVIIGAIAMFGFCKLTGKCSLDYVPQQVLDIGENLVYAAKHLEDGANLYENNLLY